MAVEPEPQNPNLNQAQITQPGEIIQFPLPKGAPTEDEAIVANTGGYTPTGIEKFVHRMARNRAINALVNTTNAASTLFIAYVFISELHRYVDSRVQDFQQFIGSGQLLGFQQLLDLEELSGWELVIIPSTFDNTRNDGIIGENNTIHLSKAEINQRFPDQVVEEGSYLYFFDPIVLPDGSRVPYWKKNAWEIGRPGYPIEELNKQAAKGIKDNIEFTLPAGGILISPVDGYGYIDMGKNITRHDSSLAVGFFIVFHDEVRNKTYWIRVSGQQSPRTNYNLISLAPNLEMPDKVLIDPAKPEWKSYARIRRGQPLIQATENQPVMLTIDAREEKTKALYLLTPRFFTDPATGKLVALGK